mgnify:CR=1 FL=1
MSKDKPTDFGKKGLGGGTLLNPKPPPPSGTPSIEQGGGKQNGTKAPTK